MIEFRNDFNIVVFKFDRFGFATKPLGKSSAVLRSNQDRNVKRFFKFADARFAITRNNNMGG